MMIHDPVVSNLDHGNLLHVDRLNDYWFKLDEPLISAFVERWRPDTNTFHMPFRECTITLQDVVNQFGLPIDGHAVRTSLVLGFIYDGFRMLRTLMGSASIAGVRLLCLGCIGPEDLTPYFGCLHRGRYLPSSDQKGPRVIATRLRLNRLGVDDDQRHQSVLEFQLVLDPRPSAMYLDWWFRVACRFFSHDRLLVDPHQGGIPADAPVRDHITALARQQEPNVPDNRCRITCEHVGTRYSQPMVTGFEDVLVLDEEQDIDDDDDDDGSNGGGGIGGGGFDWGWGGGSSGSGGGVSGSSYGVGGGNTRWGGAGGFVGPRGEGAGGLHLVVVPRVGVEVPKLRHQPYFQTSGGVVDLNVDLNEAPTDYQGGSFTLGGTPASTFGGHTQLLPADQLE
ncbi:uncharacterized protein DS421_14g447390 [Arachis hypogaea]|nr:uncharacterized protein DS421_14g447390 [Arachis hypogaea]